MIDLSTMKEVNIGEVNLKELYINNTLVWKAGILPIGYTQLDYIETDGNSWIDTGINPTSYYDYGIEYNFKGQQLAQNNTNDYLFGCLVSGKRSGNISINTGMGKTVLYLSNSSAALKKAPIPDFNTDFEVYLKATTKDAENAVFKFNGETVDNAFSPTNSEMPDANIYLCYCPNVGSTSKPFIGKVYYFNMIDVATGEKIRDYIPCINPEGKVGMYDLVSKAFFANVGSGTFTAGNPV